ncbi:MAG TPA: TMEM175 family protein [Jatrophihabitans sp.]|nr:TMEM175 family protein [Jatrophihabitans sp.]
MTKGRLLAFSDGVIAILITIMVLELRVPHGADWSALREDLPVLLAYVLSFVNVGIYWNNHHHMLFVVNRVSGASLWANLHLLFWLSLVPFTTAWMSENNFAALPVAVYDFVLLAAAIAYYILQTTLLRVPENTILGTAVGRDVKGKLSPFIYAAGVGLAFVDRWLGVASAVVVAVTWFVPDRRVERTLAATGDAET